MLDRWKLLALKLIYFASACSVAIFFTKVMSIFAWDGNEVMFWWALATSVTVAFYMSHAIGCELFKAQVFLREDRESDDYEEDIAQYGDEIRVVITLPRGLSSPPAA